MFKKKKIFAEKRKFLRLKSVFPVEYLFVYSKVPFPEWHQGYTSNVSGGGICIGVNRLLDSLATANIATGIRLKVRIYMPLHRPPIEAEGEVVWIDSFQKGTPAKYHIGVHFVSISPSDRKRLLSFARWHVWMPRLTALALSILTLAWGMSLLYNINLEQRNHQLVQHLVDIQRKESRLSSLLGTIREDKRALAKKMDFYNQRIKELKAELDRVRETVIQRSQKEEQLNEQLALSQKTITSLKEQITALQQEKIPLENQYALLVKRENMMNDELGLLKRQKEGLEKGVWQQMARWLKVHQSPTTGLIRSYEGDVGIIQDWAFIYDQALGVNAFLLANEIKRARRILNFFERKMTKDFQGFHNAYFYDSGKVAEYTVHCGPNTWVGIAIMQYIHKTGNKQYLPLAEKIAKWLMAIQAQDPAGGLRGGPRFSWFSTEHNLDAYAFFKMLYRMTGKEEYGTAAKKVLNWLQTYAMVKHSDSYRRPPINRGRGDSTIATDTFAWSLAAIGPALLEKMQMDPEEIMNFAEKHCGVTVSFKRPSGVVVKVSGFDFAKYTHMPRGGMISPEWTSQMIISFQILAHYLKKKGDLIKANYCAQKARFYLNELNKLIIASPSPQGQGEGCLPYATLENADTGHGWRTPRGTSTGSVAGTAYMMMAIKGFNPLTLDDF